MIESQIFSGHLSTGTQKAVRIEKAFCRKRKSFLGSCRTESSENAGFRWLKEPAREKFPPGAEFMSGLLFAIGRGFPRMRHGHGNHDSVDRQTGTMQQPCPEYRMQSALTEVVKHEFRR